MFRKILNLLPTKTVYAHCDIPCGIYDPHQMQLASHTVIRMVKMLEDLKPTNQEPPFEERRKIISQIARLTKIKEDHAEIVKHEVRVLWGDYFKEEHLKDYPNLHDLVFKTLKLASKAKQNIDLNDAQNLLEEVQKIAEIFYKTKGVKPIKIKSIYPTEGEIVTYK